MSYEERKTKKYVFIGGGVGIAPIFPQVKWLYHNGVKADVIIGARTHSLLVYEDELSSMSNLYVTTDDGTSEYKGLVTEMLQRLVDQGNHYDEIIAIGPVIMMKVVSELAQKLNIKCTISMNALMVDGTGMCGGCRVIVGGETKFACVDGPDFDGHKIDWDAALKRSQMFKPYEKRSCEEGRCRITGKEHCNA